MDNLQSIIEENERRLARINRIYDPVKGDPDDTDRFLFNVPGFPPFWLPVTMRKEPLLKEIEAPADSVASPAEKEMLLKRLDHLRCRHDFPYWAATRAFIKQKGGGEDILFILNRPQRKLVATLERMRRANEPIRLILLKARQWGGSTCIQLYMSWLQLEIQKGLNSLIIAHYNTASEEIKDMFDRMLMNYRPEGNLRRYALQLHSREIGGSSATLTDGTEEGEEENDEGCGLKTECVGRSGSAVRVVERNCKVKVATAQSPEACRGGDYNLIHCSEVGLWRATRLKTPEQILRSACSGVLLRPLTMIVYESTANGTGTFFHREYEAAKRGDSQFSNLFVAWYEIDQYSLPFRPGAREEFARKLWDGKENRQTDSDRRQSGAYLWWLWEQGATLEAINWYIAERAKYSDPNQMAAEYPSDDIEAFVHSGAAVFDKYKVEALRKDCFPAPERGEIVGSKPNGAGSLEDLRFINDMQGCLNIWRHPAKDPELEITDRYVTVVDIGGRSAGADWSVIAVFDREPMRRGLGPEIVAQWRGHCDFDILAWNAARIAKYYEKALLVIESNTIDTRDAERNLEGDQSLYLFNRLRDAYDNLYARRGSEESVRKGFPQRYGFHTNVSTKPMIIAGLISVIREGAYIERDERCLDEYLTYERRPNGSYGALPGHHDDLLMTRAIGLHICINELDAPVIRHRHSGSRRYRKPLTHGSF